jgi:hypothetical protein
MKTTTCSHRGAKDDNIYLLFIVAVAVFKSLSTKTTYSGIESCLSSFLKHAAQRQRAIIVLEFGKLLAAVTLPYIVLLSHYYNHLLSTDANHIDNTR